MQERFRFTRVERSYGPRYEWNAYDTVTGVYIEHAATKAEAKERIKAEAKTYEELSQT